MNAMWTSVAITCVMLLPLPLKAKDLICTITAVPPNDAIIVRLYRLDIDDGHVFLHQTCESIVRNDTAKCSNLDEGSYVLTATTSGGVGSPHSLFQVYGYSGAGLPPTIIHLDSAADGTQVSMQITAQSVLGSNLQGDPLKSSLGESRQLYLKAGFIDLPVTLSGFQNTLTGLPDGFYVLEERWGHGGNANLYETTFRPDAVESAYRKVHVDPFMLSAHVTPGDNQEQPQLLDLAVATPTGLSHYSSTFGNTGLYTFRGLLPGNYQIESIGKDGAYISGTSVRGEFVKGSSRDVACEAETCEISVELQNGSSSISGKLPIQLEAAKSKYGIVIVGSSTGVIRMTQADKNGSWSVAGLPEDEYTIFGWQNVNEVPYRLRELLRIYERTATNVVLHAGEHVGALDVQTVHFSY